MSEFDAESFVRDAYSPSGSECDCKIGTNQAAVEMMDAISFQMKRQKKVVGPVKIAAELTKKIDGFSVSDKTVKRHLVRCLEFSVD